MQFAQRVTDGLLCGKTVQRRRFPVPIRDHRVQVFDDNGLAALFEHLREVTGARLRSLVLGTINAVWFNDSHEVEAYKLTGTRPYVLGSPNGLLRSRKAFLAEYLSASLTTHHRR